MAVVKQENTDINEYKSIVAKLKKLHDIAKTNEKPKSGDESQADDNKLGLKRKTELDFDGLSDDSALHSSTNKIKRRRFSDSQDYSVQGDINTKEYYNNTSTKGEKKYILCLSNLPGEWTYEKIKQYVTNECGVNVLKMTDSRTQKSDYRLRLRFTNEEQYKNVLNKLQSKEVDGKLMLEIEDDSDSDTNDSDATMLIGKSEIKSEDISWMPNTDVWDPEGLYGLKPEFLKSLDIVPPLVKWVNVTNFRCDKSELRDVFEMAGRVVICVVTQTMNKYAKIMYSHPLEAVQAVSMLNGQTFYGQRLKVVLDPFAENSLPLPKGLQNFGPGLGKMGKPLRDVVVEFERFLKGKESFINDSVFGKSDEDLSEVSMDRYSPSKPSTSEGFGQFGVIGQRKVSTETNIRTATSPRPGPSNDITSSLGLKPQINPPVYPNPLANNSLGSHMIQLHPQNTSLLGPSPIDQYRYQGPNMQKISTPICSQVGQHNVLYTVPSPGLPQYPTDLNIQGPMASFQGQPGPNFQSQSGTNPVHQNSAQFNAAGNPQLPVSNFRSNMPFTNKNEPIGPMSTMSGPSLRTPEAVPNSTNLGTRPVQAPNAPLPVSAPNVPLPVPAIRASSGPLPGPVGLPQGPHRLPLGSNGQNVGPIGPPQLLHGPPLGPNGPFQGPNGPFQGPNGPFQGPNGPFQGPNGPFQGPNGPFQRLNAPLQRPNGPLQGPNGPLQGPNGPFQGPNGPLQGPNGPPQGPNGPPQGPNRLLQGQRSNSLPGVMVLKGKNPVTLQVINLPAQVNFASLCGRLSKVGQVVSLEFTSPGCALVKFDNPSEAERCFQYYSPSRYGNELGLI